MACHSLSALRPLLLGLLLLGASRGARAQVGVPYLAEPPPTSEVEEPDVPSKGKRKAREVKPAEEAVEPAVVEPLPTPPVYAPQFFADLWTSRRTARALGQATESQRLLDTIVLAKEKSGWPNLFAYGGALARESARTADKEEALALAAAAVTLAPDRPQTHAALGRALWLAGGRLWAGVVAYARAYSLTFTEPPLLMARLGNLLLTLVAALWLAAMLFAASALYGNARMLVHDLFHFLPTGASRWQTGLLGVAVFLAPVFFRVGVAWTVLAWLTAMGLYYPRRERIAAISVLALLALVPISLPWLTRYLAYPGSRAEAVYLAARDLGATAAADRLAGLANPTARELHVLGLRARWAGDLTLAATLFSRAESAGGADASLFTTLGNVRFLLKDKQGAIDCYQKATRADPDHVVAFLNMSRVYYDMTEHQKAGDAHRRATAIDDAFVERHKRGEGVIEEAVPRVLFQVSADLAASERAVDHLWRLLGTRRSPRYHFAAISLTAMLLMVLFAFLRTLVKPSVRCTRCGRAACLRCAPEVPNQEQCGQCYHAFVAKVTVDAQARIHKEIEVHRYQARTAQVRRVMSLVLAGAAQLLRGDPLRGLGLFALAMMGVFGLATALDVVPAPLPVLAGRSYPSAVLSGLLWGGAYALSLWHAQRQEK